MTHPTTLARTQHLKRTTDKGRRAHQPQRENTYYCKQEAQIESVSLGWACKHTKLNELACLASL